MNNKCITCNKETKNPKFCSKTCSAKHNNKIPKRKKKLYFCFKCNSIIKYRNKFCDNCNPFKVNWTKVKYKDLICNRKYQKNSRIRELARKIIFKLNIPKKCSVCDYDKHIEVCHIKPISSYPEDTLISIINNLTNLILLCPNHHWELDNNLLFLDSPFLATYSNNVSTITPD